MGTLGNESSIPTITTDVLIIGCGPAGASLGSFLGYHGVKGLMVSRSSSTAKTPRAHYTNPGAMECMRDIGLEDDFLKQGNLETDIATNFRWTNTMIGKEYFRSLAFGSDPHKRGNYWEASPCTYVDLPQTYSEPILLKYATQNGFQLRFDMEFISFEGDVDGDIVTTMLFDTLTNQHVRVKSKYVAGADGAKSKVIDQLGISLTDKPGGVLAMNVLFDADLSQYMEGRVGLLHVCFCEDKEMPPWSLWGVLRMIKPWSQWIMVMFAAPGVERIDATREEVAARTKELLGGDVPGFKLGDVSFWKVNEQYANDRLSKGNVFCLGDAIHRHPPHSGFGSNTCIQDAYNLAWKMAYVLQGKASRSLLSSFDFERQPVAQQIVTRANDSARLDIGYAQALGMLEPTPAARSAAMKELQEPGARQRRQQLRKLQKDYEIMMSCPGSELNQVYEGNGVAIHFEDEVNSRPPFERDVDHYYQSSTYPGFRLPHAWLNTGERKGKMISTQDLAGKGRFTLLTGVGGKEVWSAAAKEVMAAYSGIEVLCYSIGIGQDYEDMYWQWEEKREVEETGVILVRPDRFVGWRYHNADSGSGHADALVRAVGTILGFEVRASTKASTA